jgi:aminoglycoside N3'-acetyltransferase
MTALSELIRQLGLKDCPVCIHSSMRSFDPRLRTTDLISAFLDSGCTLLVPTFSYFYEVNAPDEDQPARNGIDYALNVSSSDRIYDENKNALSVEDMGTFPAAVLAQSDRVRGYHPLNSFAAVGNLASELIAGQDWEDVYAPLRRLTELDGKLLLMGTDLTALTFIHYAESLAGRELFVRWARNANHQAARARTGSCSRAFNQLVPDIAPFGTELLVQNSLWQVFPAESALEALVGSIIRDPGITHCGDDCCLRCQDAVAGGPSANDPGLGATKS